MACTYLRRYMCTMYISLKANGMRYTTNISKSIKKHYLKS